MHGEEENENMYKEDDSRAEKPKKRRSK